MSEEFARIVLRLVVGGIFLAQGYRKALADEQLPHGLDALTTVVAAKRLPAPRALALLVAWVELIGGLLVLIGLLTRLALIPLAAITGIAAVAFKRQEGFFGGWDWPLSVFASSIALLLLGPGRYSIDALLGIDLPL